MASHGDERRVRAPGFDVVVGPRGSAFVVHELFRSRVPPSPWAADAAGWLASPDVPGIAPLIGLSDGSFRYASKGVVTVRDLLVSLRARGARAGARAAVDLLRVGGELLMRAARGGGRVGLGTHGAITPWTLLVDGDGGVELIAYGVPRVDVLGFLEDEAIEIGPDALRYTPPEVLDDGPVDATSDLYALALVAAELCAGEPVFSGPVDDVVEAIHGGYGPDAVEGLIAELGLVEVIGRAVSRGPAERFRDARALLRAADGVRDAQGPSLGEVVRQVLSHGLVEVDVVTLGVARRRPVEAAPARPAEPPPPPPGSFDPRPTRARGEVPPLAALSGAVTLERVRSYAAEVVARADGVATRAEELAATARAESPESARSDADFAESAARRARKASESARSAARLVDLDETAAEAQVTLDLVLGAARQGDTALGEVVDSLVEVRRRSFAAAREAEEVRALRSRGLEALQDARAALERCDRAYDALVADVRAGRVPPLAADEDAGRLVERARASLQAAETASQILSEAPVAAVANTALDRLLTASRAVGSSSEAALARIAEVRGAADRFRHDAIARAEAAAREVAVLADRLAGRIESVEGASEMTPTETARHALDAARVELTALRRSAARLAEDAAAVATAPDAQSVAAAAERASRSLATAQDHVERGAAHVDEALQATRIAAERAAALEAARGEVERLHQSGDAGAQGAEEVVGRLLADTAEVVGREAREAIRAAQDGLAEVRRHVGLAAGHRGRALEARDESVARAALGPLGQAVAEIERTAAAAIELARVARERSNREMAEIRRRQQAKRALEEAIAGAQGHADRCRALVDECRALRETVRVLLGTMDLSEVRGLLAEADEVIDIAAYQASEAQDAARHAAREDQLDDAARYADTARSFLDRITEDLPVAQRALRRAESLVRRDAERVAMARSQVVEVRDLADAAERLAVEAVASARHEARGLADPEVGRAVDQLDQIARELAEASRRVRAAERQLEQVAGGADADAVADPIRALRDALVRAPDRIDEARAQVQARADAERAESDATARGRNVVVGARGEADAARAVLAGALDAAMKDVAAFAPLSAGVRAALRELSIGAERAGNVVAELEGLVRSLAGLQTSAEIAPVARHAQSLVVEVQDLANHTPERARDVVQRAKTEAEDREATERRRRTEAVRRLADLLARARTAGERGRAAGAVAAQETSDIDSVEVRDGLSLVERGLDELVALQREMDVVAAEAEHSDPEPIADRVAAVLERLERAADQAVGASERVRDAARRAAEVAQGLARVRAEVAALAGRARAAAEVARVRAGQIADLVARADEGATREVATRASEAVDQAEKSAKKAAAAAPMAALASDLDGAEPVLRAARLAAERAETLAGSVSGLLEEARRRLADEAAAAAARLEDARALARQPANDARAVAERAQGFVTMATAEAAGVDGSEVAAALAVLRSAADEVALRADVADREASALPDARSLADVDRMAPAIAAAADATHRALAEATTRLDAVRAAVTARRDELVAIERARVEARGAVGSAEEAARGIQTSIADLERLCASEPVVPPESRQALDTMRAALERAEAAALQASLYADEVEVATRRTIAEDGAGLADEVLEDAIAALARAVDADKTARAALDRARQDAARRVVEEDVADRRRLPRRTAGASSRADRLRERLVASPAPSPAARPDPTRPPPRPVRKDVDVDLALPAPESRPTWRDDPGEDRIEALRRSLRGQGGPPQARSERTRERRADETGRRPRRTDAEVLRDEVQEDLAPPRARPLTPPPADPVERAESEEAEARRAAREALRSRLRRTRTDLDE